MSSAPSSVFIFWLQLAFLQSTIVDADRLRLSDYHRSQPREAHPGLVLSTDTKDTHPGYVLSTDNRVLSSHVHSGGRITGGTLNNLSTDDRGPDITRTLMW